MSTKFEELLKAWYNVKKSHDKRWDYSESLHDKKYRDLHENEMQELSLYVNLEAKTPMLRIWLHLSLDSKDAINETASNNWN